MAIKLSAKIKVKHGYKKLNKIFDDLPKTLPELTKNILQNIRGYAVRLEKGHNEGCILFELIDTSTNEVKGRVYTDKVKMPYAMFEHFGTGAYAEMPHVGVTKHFIESSFTEWFIPVGKAPKPLPYPIITINEMQFYIAHGVKANHFITDAEFQSREQNIKIVDEKIKELLKEACKWDN